MTRRLVALAALLVAVAAGAPGKAEARGGFKVLATGDSMIQIIDSFMKERLKSRGVRVKSDARISTGISKPSMLDWVRHARRQASRIRPDVTVVFIGANDGFPIGGVQCCGPAWIRGYAHRARLMMSAYARGGSARVYWCLLPAPRGGEFRRVYSAVDAALRRAQASRTRDVRLIHFERVFTPGFRFRPVIRWHGRLVHARQSDGVHLSRSGASIAASILIHTLTTDGSWTRLGGRPPRRDRVVRRPSS
jgi:hypothetical protein